MEPQRLARIVEMAEKLDRQVDLAQHSKQQDAKVCTVNRQTYRYVIIHNGKIVYYGITADPRRRLADHRSRWPGAAVQVIEPAVSRETALEWRSASKRALART